jgi:hypothetical protein
LEFVSGVDDGSHAWFFLQTPDEKPFDGIWEDLWLVKQWFTRGRSQLSRMGSGRCRNISTVTPEGPGALSLPILWRAVRSSVPEIIITVYFGGLAVSLSKYQ